MRLRLGQVIQRGQATLNHHVLERPQNHATVQRCASGGATVSASSQARLNWVAWNPTGIVTETGTKVGDKTSPEAKVIYLKNLFHSAADRRTNIRKQSAYKMQSSEYYA